MANLLQAIQRNSQPQPTGMEDETGKLAALLRAKSGKAGGGEAPISSLGEQQANVNTNAQLGQVAGNTAVQQAGLQAGQQAQNTELATQKSAVAQQNRFNTVQAKLDTSKLLDEYARNKGDISLAQDKSKVAQLGFNLRMQNQQYVENLQREGARARLNDANQFKQELQAKTFGDNEELFRQQLGNKSILDASNNEFQRAMGTMTADQAYEAFHNQVANEKDRAMYTGIASVAGAGIGAASKSQTGGAAGPADASTPMGSSASDYTSISNTRGSNPGDYKNL